MQSKPLGARLLDGQTVYGGWTVVADPLAAAAMAGAGLDYVVVDLQHGAATEKDLPALTRAITLAGAAPVGRVRYAHPADIGRALDLGCEGVIVPNVESAAQARQAAGACRYPPAGYRSGGGALTSPSEPFCIVMVESIQAMDELPSTLEISGVDGVYVGPRDLSYSLGCELDPGDPVLSAAFEQIWAACAQAGKPVGVHCTDGATARRYARKGCRLINVASDVQTISRGVANELTAARQ